MPPNSVARPRVTLPVITTTSLVTLYFLVCAKFYTNYALAIESDAAQVAINGFLDRSLTVAAAVLAAVALSALLAPALLRAAGATPLRAVSSFSWRKTPIAWRIVWRLTPYFAASSTSVGSREPTG